MRAVVINEFIPFDQARVGDLPDPAPAAGEVIVDLHASDTNFPDILYIEGNYQRKPAFPFSPGLAGAGVISAVGDGVDPARIGERVLVLPSHGTYAQKVSAPAGWCFPMPDNMPFATAAAFGLVYQSAYFALMDRARFQKGDRVLVLGATGGIGMAAVQLAKAMGASTVIAATRGAEGAAFARQLGADMVIDSGMENLRDRLRSEVHAVTDGDGVDIIIDPVGGDLAGAAFRALAWRGRFVVVGFASGGIPKFAGNHLLVKNVEVSGVQWTDYRARQLDRVQKAQADMFALWSQGALTPVISTTHDLSDFAQALMALNTAQARGKIILTIEENS